MMRRQESIGGFSAIIAVIGAAFLLIVVLAFTMSMSLSASRATSDQSRTLGAQYAAESGLSHAAIKLKIVDDMVRHQNLNLTGVTGQPPLFGQI